MAPHFLRVVVPLSTAICPPGKGYYTVREPEQSTSTALRRGARPRHYVRPLGRTALGARAACSATGWRSVQGCSDSWFSAHLTEDIELQLDLLLDGELVGFLPDAVVQAEMPTSLEGARTQNERWEPGPPRSGASVRPPARAAAVDRPPHIQSPHADAVLDQLVPPLSVLAAGTALVTSAAILVQARTAARLGWFSRSRPSRSTSSPGCASVVFRERSTPALLRAPRLVVWKVGLWVRMLVRRGDVAWTRTGRNPA